MLDLEYSEDVEAETDMNVVMNSGGAFIEVQGTAEGHAFRREELDAMLNLAATGTARLFGLQLEARRAEAIPCARCVARRARDRQSAGKLARNARDPRGPRPRGRRAIGSRHRAARRGRRYVRRERAPQGAPRRCDAPGCPRSPTIPASRWMRSAARPGLYSARYAGPGRR